VRVAANLTALLVAAVSAGAHAEIYKWVDEKGIVNYGSKPPAGARKLRQLDENASTVSTTPARRGRRSSGRGAAPRRGSSG
jgi:hypothetical protein